METDTVHHCGGALSGIYAVTLTVTDIWTSWTECRAMWGLSMKGVTDCIIYSLFMTPKHGVLIMKNGLVDSL